MRFIAQEVRELMAQLGFRAMNEIAATTGWRSRTGGRTLEDPRLRLPSNILYQPDGGGRCRAVTVKSSRIKGSKPAPGQSSPARRLGAPATVEKAPEKVELPIQIRNGQPAARNHSGQRADRAAMARAGLPEDTIRLTFNGSAAPKLRRVHLFKGITLRLEGDANDYLERQPQRAAGSFLSCLRKAPRLSPRII